jgi:hypothetical protein
MTVTRLSFRSDPLPACPGFDPRLRLKPKPLQFGEEPSNGPNPIKASSLLMATSKAPSLATLNYAASKTFPAIGVIR